VTYTVNPQISGAEDVYQLSGRSQEVNAVGGDFSPSYSVSFLTDQLPNSLVGGFARASNATMFNSAGQRVWAPANMLVRSNDFSNASWVKTRATTTLSSDISIGVPFLFAEDSTAAATHSILQSVTFVAGVPYCFSVYVKGSGRDIALQLPTGNFSAVTGPAYFNLTTGAVALSGGATATIELVQPNVWRLSVTATCTLAGAANLIIYLASGVTNSYNGDGASGVIISAPQLEYKSVSGLTPWNSTAASAYYGPRFDYNPVTLEARGFLIEGASTNRIANSEMVGASIGVHPTTWQAGNSNGVVTSIVGTGTEDGMPYVDVRFSGTATLAGTTNLEFNAVASTTAAVGELWCGSVYIRKLSGTDPSGSKSLQLIEGNPSYLGSPGAANVSIGWGAASLRLHRPYAVGTLANAGSTNIRLALSMTYALSEVVDITMRVACPQLEGGTTPSCYAPSSPIPTYGIVATRAVDACSTAFTTWNPTEGTVFADFETNMANATAFVPALAFSDGTTANRTHMSTVITPTTIGGIMHSVVAGVTEVNLNATPVAGARCKSAYRYRLNDWAICSNGGAIAPDTLAGVLPSVTTLALGVSSTVNTPTMWRWLRKVSYYPRGLTNTELQAITS